MTSCDTSLRVASRLSASTRSARAHRRRSIAPRPATNSLRSLAHTAHPATLLSAVGTVFCGAHVLCARLRPANSCGRLGASAHCPRRQVDLLLRLRRVRRWPLMCRPLPRSRCAAPAPPPCARTPPAPNVRTRLRTPFQLRPRHGPASARPLVATGQLLRQTLRVRRVVRVGVLRLIQQPARSRPRNCSATPPHGRSGCCCACSRSRPPSSRPRSPHQGAATGLVCRRTSSANQLRLYFLRARAQ